MINLINEPDYDTIEQWLRDEATKLKVQYRYNPNRDWWLREVLKAKRKI
jgi:hypothetical protein